MPADVVSPTASVSGSMSFQCSIETPRASSSSRYARNAFRAFAIAASRVVPVPTQPGSAETLATK
jgi:hypothetical protein